MGLPPATTERRWDHQLRGQDEPSFAGLTWTYDITKSIFVEGSFGGSVNNGKTGTFVPEGRSALGCNVSFRESGSWATD